MKYHLILLILLTFYTYGCSDEAAEPDIQDQNELKEVSIDLASSWTIQEDSTENLLYATNDTSETKGQFTANLTISKLNFPDSSLQAYANYNINNYDSWDNFSIKNFNNVTLNNYDAIKAIIETNNNGNSIIHFLYFIYMNDTGYNIHFICRKTDLNVYRSEFEEMANSIEINRNANS